MRRFSTHFALLLISLTMPGCASARGGGPPANPLLDERIRGEVSARLAAEPSIGAGRVRVDVKDRVVMLHGSVSGIGALQCAITNAGLAMGVESVVDYLVLERGPRDVRCLAPRPDSGAVARFSP
jgi:hypothetical protein